MSSAASVSRNDILTLFLTAILTWSFALPVFWPLVFLVKLSSKLRSKIGNYVWKKWLLEDKTFAYRKLLFSLLRESCPQYECRRLRILELGVYHDQDLEVHSEQHSVHAAYVNSELLAEKPKRCLDNNENVVLRRERDLKDMEENSFDVVVATFLLCSVEEVQETLEDIKRILKPGGKLAFLEHVGFPENHLSYSFQRMVSPFWKILFNGCRLDRHFSRNLQNSFFSTISYTTFYPRNRFVFYRPIMIGICTK